MRARRGLFTTENNMLQTFSMGNLLKALAALGSRTLPTPRIVPAQRPAHERYVYKPHNGAQEMARRVRQMNRPGKDGIRPDVVWPGIGCRLTLNSHGKLVRFYS